MIHIKIKYDLEKIYVILMFSLFLWAGLANLWNHQLTHEFPYSYLASDSFMQEAYAEAIKQQGHYRTNPPHMSAGLDDVIGFQPSILYHLTAIFSSLSGIETYDTIVLLVFIFAIIAIFIMYETIKNWNENIAILSLPLALLVFTKNSYIGFTWGQWGVITGSLFLVAVFWTLSKLEEKNAYILLGIFLAATLLGHTSEGIMAVMFVIFYIIAKLIISKINKKELKEITVALSIGIALSIYYLTIFVFTWFRSEFSLKFSENIASFGESNTAVSLTHFGFIVPIIIIGIVLSLFMLLIKKKFNVATLAGIFMFLMGYSYLLGSGRRATQSRLFWPIYLSVFVGITLYYILKLIIKKWKRLYSMGVSLILFGVLLWAFYVPLKTPGLMDTYHWDQLMWIKENTPKNAKTYYFYSDVFSQNAVLYNAERPAYILSLEEFVQSIQNKSIQREYSSKRVKEGGGGGLPYRKSLFDYGYYVKESPYKEELRGKMDICSFDYYVFDKVSRQQVLANMNMLMREILVRGGNMIEVYSNPVVSIIKNPNPGNDCIPKEGVKIE